MLREWDRSLKTSRADLAAIAVDLHALSIRLLREVRREDDALGLTAARLSALSVLVFGGRMTLGELARAERVSLPTMTRIGAALAKAGYVKRIIEDDDRRFVYLAATRSGTALLDEGRRRRVARLGSLLTGLTDDEVRDCASALAALRRVID